MNCLRIAGGKRLLTWLAFLAIGPCLFATNNELVPVFLDAPPNDTTVNCYADRPSSITLRALLDNATVVDVSPRDSLVGGDQTKCTGGDLIRIWEVSDQTGTSRVTQVISFGPATGGPSFGSLNPPPTIVECSVANDLSDPNGFEAWRNNNFFLASSALTEACVGIASLEESINGPTEGFSCGDETVVTFTATDSCGAMAMVSFTYQTTDTEPPIFDQDPPDISIECSEAIPPVPELTATDCKDEVVISFNEVSSQLMDGSCGQYEYTITRSWTATDECGNMAFEQQIIQVSDNTPPTFDLIPNVSIECFQNPNDLAITDSVRNVMDNCTPSDDVRIVFSDEIISNPQCSQIYRVRRTWTVTDVCGNSAVVQQNIFVSDNTEPDFELPEDIAVDCQDAFNLDITGVPTELFDQCDQTPNFDFEDIILPASCPGDFRIRRQWRVFDDCGNSGGGEQIIIVRDTTPPVWSIPPSNLITTCNNTDFQEETFNLWVLDLAGAEAVDGCSENENITYEIYVSGTEEYPLLPEFVCDFDGQMVRELAVDVIATDECDNQIMETVFFRQVDTQAPNIFGCPENQILSTELGRCDIRLGLPPPVIQESCVTGLPIQVNLSDTVTLTSTASGTPDAGTTAVDTVNFRLRIDEELPINAFMPGQLTISLLNADAEAAGEFFTILGEDGAAIGTTAFSDIQCADSETIIEIPRNTFNVWASDGYIDLQLVPNLPNSGQNGSFAINDICPEGSQAVAHIFMPVRRLAPLKYEIYINDADPIRVDPVDSQFVTLDRGLHQIRYRVTDCGGNFDECIYTITVEDREPPMIDCPEDQLFFLAADSCRAKVSVPPPTAASDNCDLLNANRQTQPGPADRFLLFEFDANLSSFQAQPKTITFTDLLPIAFDTATITVFFKGDFSGPEDFFDVLDADGNVIASSTPGQADCNQEGRIEIQIPADSFNTIASQIGSLTFTLSPRPVPVPPGTNGDGVEPCPNGQPVTGNGDFDAVSYAYAELNYPSLEPSYYTYGVTPIEQQDNVRLPITQTFDLGITNFTYLVSDQSGNVDSCTFAIEVRDTIRPLARCRPNTLFVDPSGLSPVSPDPSLVDNGSFDNCGIDSMSLSPATFSCQQYGEVANVTLSIFDGSGNVDSCTTILSIAPLNPSPDANSGLCGGDSLFLFANPPTVAAPGQTVYTFRWFDPQGNFFSSDENPTLTGVDASFEGNYRVVIRGISGCEAEGVVQVTIADLPLTPVILSPDQVCIGDAIPLTIEQAVMQGNVNYHWFEGQSGSGSLLATTNDPFFNVPPPHGNNGRRFYLEVEIDGCVSAPSSSILITTTVRPEAVVTDTTVFACENTDISLASEISANSIFNWTGPDGFTATGRVIDIESLEFADEGWYFVQAVRGEGCFSEVDSLFLSILPAPAQPNLSVSAPICLNGSLDLTVDTPNALNYTFFAPNGQVIATDSSVLTIDSVTLAAEGDWQAVIDFGGCPSLPSVAVNVDISALPVVTTTSLPDPVCAGNDLILQGGSSIANSSYFWSGPDDFSSENIAPTLPEVGLDDGGWYTLEVTSPNGCQDTDSIFVEIDTGLIVTEIENLTGDCFLGGETVALIALVEPVDSSGDYSFLWSGPQGSSTSDTLFLPEVGPGTSGNYSVIATGPDGCRSPQENFLLDLNFAPSTPTAPVTVSGLFDFCIGDAFTLTTTDFGSNATYFWQLPDNSIIPTDTNFLQLLAVPPSFVGAYRVRVVVDGCSSTFSEVRIISATEFPAEMIATASTPSCEGRDIQLQVTDLPNTTYSWVGPGDFSSSLPNPLITDGDPDLHNGLYQVVATQGGCVSDTLNVFVDVQPSPDVPAALPVQPICLTDDSMVELMVNVNTSTEDATYQWFFTGTENPVSPPGQTISFNLDDFNVFPGQGEYQVSVVADLNGCISDASLPITVRLDTSDPNAAQAMEDTTVCEGIFLLQATPPPLGQGQWSLISGTSDVFIANPNSPTTAVDSLSEFGSPYEFLWSVSNGACTDFSRDTVLLSVTNGEEATAGPDQLVCLNQEIRLNSIPTSEFGSVGTWSQNLAQEILGVVIVDPSDPNTLITGLQADNVYSFTWTVQSICGTKEDVMLVNVSDPNPDAGPDLVICNEDGATVLAAAEPTIGSEGNWIVLTDGVSVDDPNSPTTMVRNLLIGDNLLLWEVDGGECGSGSMDTLIVTYKLPADPRDDLYDVAFQSSIDFDPLENDLVPAGTDVTFVDEPTAGQLLDNGDGTFTYEAMPNFTGEVTVTYQLNSDGCAQTMATVTFLIGKDVDCQAPNIFTPNNDGVNDFFVVPCLLNRDQFPASQITIYSQWGDEVYRSPIPYRGDWDGTYQGDPLPVSTYFYVIEFGDGREAATGSVRIQR